MMSGDDLKWKCPICGTPHIYEKPVRTDLLQVAKGRIYMIGRCCGTDWRLRFKIAVDVEKI
jgi:hypothetical protein